MEKRDNFTHFLDVVLLAKDKDTARQGELIAEQERKRLGLGFMPIADIINNQGIWISTTHFPDKLFRLAEMTIRDVKK